MEFEIQRGLVPPETTVKVRQGVTGVDNAENTTNLYARFTATSNSK